MKIRVRIENELLGNSTEWEGDSKDIDELKMEFVHNLAEKVIKDGCKRRDGMWIVEEIK